MPGHGQASLVRWYSYSPTAGVLFYGQQNEVGTSTFNASVQDTCADHDRRPGLYWTNVGITGTANGVAVKGTDSGTSTVIGTETVYTNNGWSVQAVCIERQHTENLSGMPTPPLALL